jgi:Na+/proline symporter
MSRADILIIAGVVFIPLAGAVFFSVLAINLRHDPTGAADYLATVLFALVCLVVAISAGLITAGVLLRKATPKRRDS